VYRNQVRRVELKDNVVPGKKRFLSQEQVQQLRSACDTNIPGGKRDLAILDSMLYQGMRLSEVANLKVEHVRSIDGNFWVQIRRRSKPIKAHTRWLQSLCEWLDQLGLSLEKDYGSIFVQIAKFVKDPRKPLSKRTISYLVARYGDLSGIAPLKDHIRLSPKDLRRSCARHAYERGASLLSLTAFLGFNHLESTARFIDVLDYADPDSAVDHIQYYSLE
jgi:site-specific recombinase XerD